GNSDLATVTITVDALPDAPVAADDSFGAVEDTLLAIDAANGVLANDGDPDAGATLTATVSSDVSHGTLALAADGSFTYTPAADYSGPDGFGYTVSDGTGSTDEGAVSITVGAVNDAPVAADDAYGVAEDGSLTIADTGVL